MPHFVLSVDEYLSCLHLAVKNNASMNIFVQVFVWIYICISFGNTQRSGTAGSCHVVNLCLTFGGTARLFSKTTLPFSSAVR